MIHSWQECDILDVSNNSLKKSTKELKRSYLVENDCKKSNRKSKFSNSNVSVDLNSIDRDKIAKLIRELGYVEVEKQKLNDELSKTKLNCNKQINDYAIKERDLIKTKEELLYELSIKEKQISELKNQISIQTKIPPKLREISDEFVLIPQNSFIGPPKLKNSYKIHEKLVLDNQTTKERLLDEQKELWKEKEWLQIILKQQKCIKKLQRNIDKAEKVKIKSKDDNPREISKSESVASCCTQTEVLQPIVLNKCSMENVSMIDESKSFKSDKCKESSLKFLRMDIEEELLISVLNNDTTRPNSSLSSRSSNSLQIPSSASSVNKLPHRNQASSLLKIVDIIDDDEDDRKTIRKSYNATTTSFFNTKLTGLTNNLECLDSPISDYLNNNTINSNTDFSDSATVYDEDRNSPPSFLVSSNVSVNNQNDDSNDKEDDDLISELFFPT